MSQVSVRFFAAAREAFGTKEQSITAGSLGDVVSTLTEAASPEAATVLSRSSFLVNSVAATDRDHPLAEGDTIDVLPPFAGG
ncbi:molybdopterin converting factor small subunit [Brevibacterium sanguinis]|uniref:Molybdopterin converting factor small subunit n=2 Tax=Brevibacterium TaxID=1696 RepID=A0A366IKL2_9MICO|nr:MULTISPECIES: MoaD/ThiS family protein [Brevibacterium]RBP64194.1 molybdopterin converting factor small subunit [Brevibacterium sanguinis]RBP71514.1 molybdopterin converting factor small subunit [Brevibacterium celere]